MSWLLPEGALETWRQEGVLLRPGYLERERLADLSAEVDAWLQMPARGLWAEPYPGQRVLERIEGPPERHPLCRAPDLLSMVALLLGKQPELLKGKLNLRPPGGWGFVPHQDAPSLGISPPAQALTVLLAVDAMTAESGALEVARGGHHPGILARDRDGGLTEAVIRALSWTLIPMQPGDLLFFSVYLPHGSGQNRGGGQRRALFWTYR